MEFGILKQLAKSNQTDECYKFIKDYVNDSNINEVLNTFVECCNEGCYMAVFEALQEIKNENLINLCIDRQPLEKVLTEDNIINLTGQSGSGKSYYAKQFGEEYIIVDTDDIFSEKRYNQAEGINKEIGLYLRSKYEKLPDLSDNFDLIYDEIINYCKKFNKTIVIDCAQFHAIKDVHKLKGKIIIMRTCISTCYKRCIERYKRLSPNATMDELNKYAEKKKKIFEWYKYSNEFIKKIIEL